MEQTYIFIGIAVLIAVIAIVMWNSPSGSMQERAQVLKDEPPPPMPPPKEEYPCNNCEQRYAKYGGLPNDQGSAPKLFERTNQVFTKCRSLSTLGVLM